MPEAAFKNIKRSSAGEAVHHSRLMGRLRLDASVSHGLSLSPDAPRTIRDAFYEIELIAEVIGATFDMEHPLSEKQLCGFSQISDRLRSAITSLGDLVMSSFDEMLHEIAALEKEVEGKRSFIMKYAGEIEDNPTVSDEGEAPDLSEPISAVSSTDTSLVG